MGLAGVVWKRRGPVLPKRKEDWLKFKNRDPRGQVEGARHDRGGVRKGVSITAPRCGPAGYRTSSSSAHAFHASQLF